MRLNVFAVAFAPAFYTNLNSDFLYRHRCVEERRRRKYGAKTGSSLRQLLTSGDFSPLHLIGFALHLGLLLAMTVIFNMFALLPQERDPRTGLYRNAALNYLEQSLHIVDIFKHLPLSVEFNRLISLVFVPSVLAKFIFLRGELARPHGLSFVPLNLGYLSSIGVRPKDLLPLARAVFKHTCKPTLGALQQQAKLSHTRHTRHTRHLKLYHQNLINFDSCFEELNTGAPHHHRLDLQMFAYLCNSFAGLYFGILIFFALIAWSTWYQHLERARSSPANDHLLLLLEGLLMSLVINVNRMDNMVAVVTGLACYSRTKRVSRLVRQEVYFHRRHLLEFLSYLSQKESHLLESLEALEFQQETKAEEKRFSLSEAHYSLLIAKYRRHIEPQSLEDRNQRLEFIVELIEVLKYELNDCRRVFTASINNLAVFTLISVTLNFSVVRRAESITEAVMVIALLCFTLLPIIYSSTAAALVEVALRELATMLYLLLAEELRLIGHSTAVKLNKQVAHLVKIENRSFTLFANFSLTFGSIFTIFGWVSNVYPLLQAQGLVT